MTHNLFPLIAGAAPALAAFSSLAREECTMDNLVLMDYNMADEHMEKGLEHTKKNFPGASAFIEKRLNTLRKKLGIIL